MYNIDPSAVPYILIAAVISGFVSAIPFKHMKLEERLTNLEMQISDLEDTLKEKNNKLTEIREKVVELLELIDDDYSDMPPLVEQ
jgi:uncharacterized coiled-coil protein SlyX